MERKNLIAGNWKMNATHLEAIQMVQKLSYRLELSDYDRVDVVVVPPFTALRSVQTVIEADHLPIQLGAQNVHFEESGAFTGEISPAMLASLRVSYVVVGHSERRQLFGEDDAMINRKVKAVLAAEMTPILAMGETLEEREAGETDRRITSQLKAGLRGLTLEQVSGMAIAYEPIWAIGTGVTASPEEAAQGVGLIRSQVEEIHPGAGNSVRIIYGGSVNAGNIAALMAKEDIDGALVGGAALDPDTFASVIRYWM
ncbi:MAG: triose-phosphate isomerase [Acidimicrobiia bacterium]|nr:triose-phosphate isomerase [Acidimicrobiia bacterium]